MRKNSPSAYHCAVLIERDYADAGDSPLNIYSGSLSFIQYRGNTLNEMYIDNNYPSKPYYLVDKHMFPSDELIRSFVGRYLHSFAVVKATNVSTIGIFFVYT